MINNVLQFITDGTGVSIDENLGTVRRLSNLVTTVQLVSPMPNTYSVLVEFVLAKGDTISQWMRIAKDANGVAYKGSDVIDTDNQYYQNNPDIANYNVWEIELFDTTLAQISKFRAGKVGVSFIGSEYVAVQDEFGTSLQNNLGTFGTAHSTTLDLPAGPNDHTDILMIEGDYYICDTLAYTSATTGVSYTYRQVVYWNLTEWIKAPSFKVKTNTSLKYFGVDAALSGVAPSTVDPDLTEQIIDAVTTLDADVSTIAQEITDNTTALLLKADLVAGAVPVSQLPPGFLIETTDDLVEGTINEYYTDAKVAANESVILNTAKVGYTDALVSNNPDVAANSDKISYTDAADVALNTDKVGITPTQAANIVTNNSKISYTDQSAVALNTAKVGITPTQASNISTNNSKISYTEAGLVAINTAKISYTDAAAVALNTNKISYTDAAAVALNTNKISYTDQSAVAANTAKISYTDSVAVGINSAKISYTDASAVALNTAKISYDDAAAVALNTAKISYTDASAVALNTAKLSADVNATNQGNTFNGNSQLVKTTADGKLPILDGSNLTGVQTPINSTDDLSEGATNLYYTDARADARVALVIDTAPEALNTLNELALAINDDPNFAASIATEIGLKANTADTDTTVEIDAKLALKQDNLIADTDYLTPGTATSTYEPLLGFTPYNSTNPNGYTDDQTGAEIKAAYETQTNAFTDAQFTKLTGIEALAEVNPLSTSELSEGTNLYYTENRVSANVHVTANTAKVGYTEALVSANPSVAANTAKIGYTEELVTTNIASDALVAANTAKISYTDAADVALNTTHRTSDGSDHSFINQDVQTTAQPTFKSIQLDTTAAGLVHTEGKFHWDEIKRQPSVALMNADVDLNLGFETLVPIKNTTGVSITDGTVLYPTGYEEDGNGTGWFTVGLANAHNKDKIFPIAVCTQPLLANEYGYASKFGLVGDVNTSAWAVGTKLYVSATVPGALTDVRPDDGSFPTVVGFVVISAVSGAIQVDIDNTELTVEVTNVNGFPRGERDNTTVSFVPGTRTFTLAGTDYHFYHQGLKVEKYANESVIISDVEGTHLIYFDGSTLMELVNPTSDQFRDVVINHASVAVIYWDAISKTPVFGLDERHGIMDPEVHYWAHVGIGTLYIAGMDLTITNIDDITVTDDTSVEFAVAEGFMKDEDLEHTVIKKDAIDLIKEFYFTGTGLPRRNSENAYGLSVGVNGRLNYNSFNGSTWSIEEAGDTNFVYRHIIAFPGFDKTVTNYTSFMGTNEYTTISEAEANVTTEKALIEANVAAPELTYAYSILYQTRNLYSNTYQSRIVLLSDSSEFFDFRTSGAIASTGTSSSITSHVVLTDRDLPNAHPATAISYDNTISGLTAINVKTAVDEVDSNLDTHIADLTNPHSVTAAQVGSYTTTATDTLLDAKQDNLTADVDYVTPTQADLDYEPLNLNIQAHIISTTNPHSVTQSQVGLDQVDNTSDINKPVSTATQTALDLKANIADTDTSAEVDAKIAALVDSAPGTLDTLNELALALGDDPNFATTITTAIGLKLDTTEFTGHQHLESDITDLQAYITGINSSDVTTALGFTPYNATNPSGYISDYTVTLLDVTDALTFTPYNTTNPDGFISDYTVTLSDVTTALTFTPYNATNPSGYEANDANTTLQGNTFNGNSQLVQTTADGKLPILDGSNLTGITAGASAINDLTDVLISTPSTGQVLKYNGTNWINDTDATGGGSGPIDDLTNVVITSATDNDFLRFNGTNWINEVVTIPAALTNTDGLTEGTSNLYYTDTRVTTNIAADTIVAANTAKTGITTQQAANIVTNTAKISYDAQSAVAANTAKVGYTEALVTANIASDILVAANTAKTGYTEALVTANIASDTLIAANTTHRGLTTGNPHNVTKTDLSLENVNNTTDLLKPISTATQTVLDLKQDNLTVDVDYLSPTTAGTTYEPLLGFTPYNSTNPDNFIDDTIVTLSSLSITESQISDLQTYLTAASSLDATKLSGTISSTNLPPIAITSVNVVVSEVAQLALTAQEGDIAVRTDLNKSYIHNSGSAGTMADWNELLTPTDTILTVNGETGTVVLNTSHIAENTNLYYTDARVSDNSDVQANTLKVGYTEALVTANIAADLLVQANTDKVGITSQQATDITTNNAKTGYTEALVTANIASDALVAANTAKTGITSQQATDITTNNDKVGYTEALVTANIAADLLVQANTAKTGITTQQASDITSNNAKISYSTAASDAVALNTNKISFDSTSSTKLSNIEENATADQTGAEIKTAYQAELNAFTDTLFTKLNNLNVLTEGTDYLTASTLTATYEPLIGYTPYNATNPDSFISDYTVTLSDVTTALTFTPYNATNPSGYEANDANTTLQGNTFNGNSQLVQLNASGELPAIDGSNLTGLPSGTVADIGDITNVVLTSLVTDNILRYNGTNWVNTTLPAGGTVADINDITNVNITTVADAQVLTYDSGTSKWINATPGTGGGASVSTDDTAPTSPSDGDLWWDSVNGIMKVYYTDTDSSAWVDASPGGNDGADGTDGADGVVTEVTNSSSAPTVTISPNVYYNFTSTALTTLTITLGTPVSGFMNDYMFQFLSPASAATLTTITGVTWLGNTPTIEASKTYQVSIVNGIGIIVGV